MLFVHEQLLRRTRTYVVDCIWELRGKECRRTQPGFSLCSSEGKSQLHYSYVYSMMRLPGAHRMRRTGTSRTLSWAARTRARTRHLWGRCSTAWARTGCWAAWRRARALQRATTRLRRRRRLIPLQVPCRRSQQHLKSGASAAHGPAQHRVWEGWLLAAWHRAAPAWGNLRACCAALA